MYIVSLNLLKVLSLITISVLLTFGLLLGRCSVTTAVPTEHLPSEANCLLNSRFASRGPMCCRYAVVVVIDFHFCIVDVLGLLPGTDEL